MTFPARWDGPRFKTGCRSKQAERWERRTIKKPLTAAQQKTAKRRRDEARVEKAVRLKCVDRDGCCVLANWPHSFTDCDGPSEWAHFGEKRRAKTRRQPPSVRHTTAGSLLLCRFHHGEYDSRRINITALTVDGADGPLKVEVC